MTDGQQYLCFRLDQRRYALLLAVVDKVVRAVAITALPDAPAGVHGVIAVQGRVVPVINMRQRLDLPAADLRLQDQLIIAQEMAGGEPSEEMTARVVE